MEKALTQASLLHFEVNTTSPGTLLRCAGEIDLSNSACLREALEGCIKQGRPEVEVDLREVTFLDSSAIDALVAACRELDRAGRSLHVRARTGTARLFRLLKLDHILHVRTD
jgi:anti-anti-sigma factor